MYARPDIQQSSILFALTRKQLKQIWQLDPIPRPRAATERASSADPNARSIASAYLLCGSGALVSRGGHRAQDNAVPPLPSS